ncbi:TniQ family protein [Prescottella equi]|uniref:TniQ family protein n=1 Tax=Rhodococcus hoagii TaxID=43767 RepID=UPI0007CD7954|nr:TniQ family protein [Prescottella equi]
MRPVLRWPIHPPPRHGESLSSWLYRIAAVYQLTVGELLEHDLGHPPVDADVLDLEPAAGLLADLSRRSGFDHDRLHRMSVSGHVPWLLDSLDPNANDFDTYIRQLSILMPTHRRGRGGRRRPGPGWRPWLPTESGVRRACPQCADDSHHQRWILAARLPLQVSCPTHRCLFEPCFGYPDHLYWDTDEPLPRPVPPAVVTLDRYTDQALTSGVVALPRRTIHSGMWFRLLRTLIDELCAPIHRAGPAVQQVWARRGGRPPQLICRPFEALPWPAQSELLTVAADTIALLGAGEIIPDGGYGHLFTPDRVGDDFPSGRARRNQHPDPNHALARRIDVDRDRRRTARARMDSALGDAIDEARRDPQAARSLFSLMRHGCRTDREIERLLAVFDELEIPTSGFRDDLPPDPYL